MSVNVLEAVRFGDIDLLKYLLVKGYSVDIKDNNGWYPMHVAASNDYFECLQLLFICDPSQVNFTTFDNTTPLALSVKSNHFECSKYLLMNGADSNICNHMGESPLHLAASKGNVAIILELLKSDVDLNIQMFNGFTPLHQAVVNDHPNVIKLLMRHGADINICDDNNIKPFLLAACEGLTGCLKMFIETFHESMTHSEIISIINTSKDDGSTPLFVVAQAGELDCVKLLLEHGADANFISPYLDALPLHIALWRDHLEIVKILLPLTTVEAINKCEYNPFLYAMSGDTIAFKLLLQHGCNIYKPSPLLHKIEDNFYELFPNIEYFQMSPLTQALILDSPSVFCDLIIENQNDFISLGKNEFPPLLAALCKDNLSVAKHLLNNGANINIYLSYPYNITLLATRNQQGLEFVLKMGAEVESLFLENSVVILAGMLIKVDQSIKKHFEHVLCQSFYNSKRANFPIRLYTLLSSKNQTLVNQIPAVRRLQELCKRVVRLCIKHTDYINNLDCLRNIMPNNLVNYLLDIELIDNRN